MSACCASRRRARNRQPGCGRAADRRGRLVEKSWNMGVAAERQTTVGRPKALKGLARSENVNPVRWRACARMDVKPVALDHRQRKAGEKRAMRRRKACARPFDRCACG